MRARLSVLCLAAWLLASGSSWAEPGDPQAGAGLANDGKTASHATASVPACRTCHGDRGIGDGSGAFPRLTGQLGFYLYKQLRDFAAGTRPSPVMSPISQALTDQDMQNVAAYYASLQGPFFPLPLLDPEAVRRGGLISASGIGDKNVPACVACHGLAGAGMEPSFPYLAGQYAAYTEYQLDQFRFNRRQNSPLNVMNEIAARMDDGDIAAVAAYFAAVRQPDRSREARSGAGPASPYAPAPLTQNQGTR